MFKKISLITKILLLTATIVASVFTGLYIRDNFLYNEIPAIVESRRVIKVSNWCVIIKGVAYRELYGTITEVDVRSLWRESLVLKNIHSVDKMVLYINTYGGSLTDTFGFADWLVQMQEKDGIKVEAVVIGAAMSGAIPILAVCSYRTATENVTFMVHNPVIVGRPMDASDKGYIDGLTDKYAKLLARNTFLSEEEWRQKMLLKTFFDSEQAFEWGLIDEIR